MLAQSLFTAPASPIADQASGGRATGVEPGTGFEGLLDLELERAGVEGTWGVLPQVSRQPEILPAEPDAGQGFKLGDAGPQIRPDVPDAGPAPKQGDGTGPQIRPDVPDVGPPAKPRDSEGPQVRPEVPDTGLTDKPRDEAGPQIRPDTPDEGLRSTRPADDRQGMPAPTVPRPVPDADRPPAATQAGDGPDVDLESAATADGRVDSLRAAAASATGGASSPAPILAAALTPSTSQTRPAGAAQEPVSRLRDPRAARDGLAAEAPRSPDEPARTQAATPTSHQAPAPDPFGAGQRPSGSGPAPSPLPADATTTSATPPEPTGADRAAEPAAPAVTSTAAPTDGRGFAMSRVGAETLADLSAQIVRRLEGRSTRFEMALTPEHLGRVDVNLEIGEDGGLTAHLTFDTPAAAAELRSRVDELRRQLEQAGFQLGRDALEFSQRDPSSSGRHDGWDRRSGRAFAAARDLAGQTEAAPLIRLSLFPTPDRVDLKV